MGSMASAASVASAAIGVQARRKGLPASPPPEFEDSVSPRHASAREELAGSLAAPRAWLAPKYFYDRLGSALFTSICELPEYYPTRTEAAIFQSNLGAIAQAIGPAATLIDLGAGDCQKAASLFAAVSPAQYVAVDISVDFVRRALAGLQLQFPDLQTIGLGMDFSRELSLPPTVRTARRVFFYPGSSIGNFTPEQAGVFLRQVHREIQSGDQWSLQREIQWDLPRDLGHDGGLLIGVDFAKDPAILEPAYDDPLGVTAAFNLNVLNHVNRVLGSDFEVAGWEHVAFFNAGHSRIEMHLRARRAVTVGWPGGARHFEAGEMIHTENSYKYSRAGFETLLRRAGLRCEHCWSDDRNWFGVFFARPV